MTTTTTTIPLTVSSAAQIILASATGQDFQGSIIESFSAIADLQGINISTTLDRTHLAISVKHLDQSKNDCLYIQCSDLQQPTFDASETAKDLSSLYREFTLKEFNSKAVEED